ncbi:hypothetical protein WICPIJ_000755 [Wickerhamomyces pijperi]|uniref:Uncharacterized protein n=1 Tax=Wickerhamomyces pijperi TaxID=599730 RepID=A0A9P8QG40_WICPI|nr:hypothetical protein WICPIJ_000755 [Wickerhamomyces pijperi]
MRDQSDPGKCKTWECQRLVRVEAISQEHVELGIELHKLVVSVVGGGATSDVQFAPTCEQTGENSEVWSLVEGAFSLLMVFRENQRDDRQDGLEERSSWVFMAVFMVVNQINNQTSKGIGTKETVIDLFNLLEITGRNLNGGSEEQSQSGNILESNRLGQLVNKEIT